ncbi:RNB-domain-containing protein [Piedraia hortae CBS 480.64]|uniref:RNB-domain-containing protein n=1 Tax=Piedraia hortae CBS 480.64 TaxID=1314780 RepID=A0A6A7C6I9_9PEZI|nr:RNB-domain-containing protein [Piedraia hortae CBS 480.64]
MDQHGQMGPPGQSGRRLHIAHRRSPSEMTPLIMEQLALAQQIEALQQQQQQIAATHQQYVNMGVLPAQQPLSGQSPIHTQFQNLNLTPNPNFQFPQVSMGQQHLGIPMTGGMAANPSGHRRNQSALPNVGTGSMGPPPAPSSGASGFNDFGMAGSSPTQRENAVPFRGRGGSQAGGGHNRRHSLALPEAKKAAELAEAKRKSAGYQFNNSGDSPATSARSVSPGKQLPDSSSQQGFGRGGSASRGHGRSQSMATGQTRGMASATRGGPTFSFPQEAQTGFDAPEAPRRGSQGHARTGSRNFEGNWRQPQTPVVNEPLQQAMGNFQLNQSAGNQSMMPGHRQRGSLQAQSVNSLAGFQFPAQQPLMPLQQGQILNQQANMALRLAQLQAYSPTGLSSSNVSPITGHNAPFPTAHQAQHQQRKTLFTPYLPQAHLPALLADGHLVAGVLRVNKKNRSDAYVTTTDLDADIFICGSKDRNRALEGDLVAVELLDVGEVWAQKREKEEKKKRKDFSDHRTGTVTEVNDATTQPESASSALEGGIRRRGSLKQRPTQKKNDDVEVEGQSLLLMEEDEINDEQKPLYAGHIVAVIERVAGQMFSGTLGLLRPSSQATKEKQEAERREREGGNPRQQERQSERQQERPKIVWFKPTDKRVPLIAIPTEQAPRDFVEKHQDYASKIFVASIKRWPITSLHPFGTLVEQLGEAGDLKVETDALLRDNNFGSDEFSDAVIRNVGFEDWSVANDGEDATRDRRDFRDEQTFTIDPNGSSELDDAIHFKDLGDGFVEVGVHVTDIAHFVKANSLVDREAKKRGTGVYLMNRTVNMLPPRLSQEICCLAPGEDRYTVSVVFKIAVSTGRVVDDEMWIGKSIIKSSGKLSYEEVDAVINDNVSSLDRSRKDQILQLHDITQKFRRARFGVDKGAVPSLRLIYQLDDENVPVEQNIFDSSPAHEMIEELSHKTNTVVAQKLYAAMPDRALLRRQAPPNLRRLQTVAERMANVGIQVDTSSSAALQKSLFSVKDDDVRKGLETLIIKSMPRAKYYVPGKVPSDWMSHYALNLPIYTHFTNPTRRYADIAVHRQLEAALSGKALDTMDDLETLAKTAETCNTKKDSAFAAQEQSVHIESCRAMHRLAKKQGSDLISVGVVVCVYESAFDVVIPEYGFEKRVHCDQLPLKKAEFNRDTRLLELYWEKGVPVSTFVPKDEQPQASRGYNKSKNGTQAQRQDIDTGSMDTRDVDALYDDDDDASESNGDLNSGVALEDRHTPSPRNKETNKQKYLGYFKLREADGDFVQEVREMTRVPVLLKTDLTKSPPCLAIRSLNPFAL